MKVKPEQLLPEELDIIEDNAFYCLYGGNTPARCPHCQDKIKLLRHIVWLNDIIEDLWKEYVENG